MAVKPRVTRRFAPDTRAADPGQSTEEQPFQGWTRAEGPLVDPRQHTALHVWVDAGWYSWLSGLKHGWTDSGRRVRS
jgi:hypothetical protein